MRPAGPLFHGFAVVSVSAWLLLAAGWLLLRGRLPARPLLLVGRAMLRRRHRAVLADLQPELGRCFVARVGAGVPSDADIGSRLVVLEDGVPLPHAHAAHDDIRRLGGGRYSHWGDNVYFATRDDSDPRTNGRRYTVEER
ncbi:MAG: hypothetical protein KF830_17610 [Planctomycetes bacterium]|nr:hypothetical protein [Planctomycetota bacterium]